MPYIKEVCKCGIIVEVSKYHTIRYKGGKTKRNKRSGTTSETQKKINQRNTQKHLTRLINANFKGGDLYLTLTYRNEPKTTQEAKKDIFNYIRRLKYEYRKYNQELKYIHSTEYNAKRIHHHIIINKIPELETTAYDKKWLLGYVDSDNLSAEGEYSKLAYYLIKETSLTYNTSDGVYAKRYCQSKNLKKPVITKTVINAKSFSKVAKAYKGYELIEDKTIQGYTESGYQYISYVMRKKE